VAALVIFEIKTRIYDVQALLAGLDRKARLAPQLLRADRGWTARSVAKLVVVAERTANRRVVADHEAVFGAALPTRGGAVRGWLREPSGSLSGVWFLSSANRISGIQVTVGRQRVRVPRTGGSVPKSVDNANIVDV
jgi:hypothetical protein